MNIYKYMAAAALALSVSACQTKEPYVIESDPDVFAVYPLAQVASRDGDECKITVTGHEEWTMSIESSAKGNWCVPDVAKGNGMTEITFKVTPANSPSQMRSAVISIKSGDKVMKTKIIQETLLLKENEVLIDGVIWTTTNLDAPGTFVSSPDEVGMYYQFNRKVGYPSTGGVPQNWPASYDYEDCDWLPENDPCPEGYRICTAAEMVKLWETGATWRTAKQTGFKKNGMIVGVPAEVAATATKDNFKSLGALFIPQSGWRNDTGAIDRNWLVAIRTGSQLSRTHGGMSLGDSGGYRDVWGWGDGPKERASAVRCVRNIAAEE